MNPALLPSLIVVVGASAWGVYWIPVRMLEEAGLGSGWAVAAFNLPALLVAVLVPFSRPAPNPRAMRLIALAGIFAGCGFAFYAMGLILTSVVRATLLFYLTPIWSTLLAMAFLGERPGVARWSALTLGLLGLGLTLGATPADMAGNFGLGEALGLISGVSWAFAAVVVRRLGEREGPSRAIDMHLVLHQFFWTVVLAAGAAWALGEAAPTPRFLLETYTVGVVAFALLVLASLYAIFWAIAQLSPGRSGLLMMSEVVVAVISAAILLPDEAMNAREWLGAALIVGAGVVEVFGGRRVRRAA